jgi:hypothetical protein
MWRKREEKGTFYFFLTECRHFVSLAACRALPELLLVGFVTTS